MCNETGICNIVNSLIEKKKEGEYWDFKEKWHSNSDELVKDIICFANTVHNMDCYLIIGVSDDFQIVGVSDERRKQSDIIHTLSTLSFAGDNIPKISVETITIGEKIVDVLIIHNTYKTPIYLKKQYGAMRPGCIYTRNGDKNTQDNGNAEIDEIENLWRKRFGLTKPPLEYIIEHLFNKLEWTKHGEYVYNLYKPEYQLHYYDDEEYADRIDDRDEFYAYSQTNEHITFSMLDIMAHGTVLDSYQTATLDGGILSIPTPEWGFIPLDQWHNETYAYKYYIEKTDRYRIFEFMYDQNNSEQQWAYQRFMEVILLYKSETEKTEFEEYVECSIGLIKKDVSSCDRYSYIATGDERKNEVYRENLCVGYVLNKYLDDWRKSQKL